MVQANSVAASLQASFGLDVRVAGGIMVVLTAVVIIGGIKRIATVTELMVPVMALFYLAGGLIVILLNLGELPRVLGMVLDGAFSGTAAAGGFAGSTIMMAMRYGVARGLFSNESGLGSAPIVAAAAMTRNPVRQALVSSTGTFWDTVVVCAMTGLVLINSGAWQQGLNGAALTKAAFADLPVVGPIVLTLGLLTFVFSTILGWSYYGEKAAEYLFGGRVVKPYRLLWVVAVMVGSVATLPMVWSFADIANGLMAVPNLVSLLALSPVLVAETREYLWRGRLDQEAAGPG